MTPFWRSAPYRVGFIVTAEWMNGSQPVRYAVARPWADCDATICEHEIKSVAELPEAVSRITRALDYHRKRLAA